MKRLSFQKLSFQKFSLLGFILMGVSLITAAVLPSNSKDNTNLTLNGSITASDDNNRNGSCTITDVINNPCNNTASCTPRQLSGSTRPSNCESFSNNTTLEEY